MSTERPEFRPIESTPPAKRAWPFVVIGALLVAVLLFAVRRDVTKVAAAATQPQPAAPKPVAETPKTEPAAPPAAKTPEGPNVLGTAVGAARSLAMVARSELDREIARTKGAQKEVTAYRKQIE